LQRIGRFFDADPLNLRANPKVLFQCLRAKSRHSGVLGETDMTTFARFIANEDGATAIEYGLIAALIAVVIITAVTAVGTSLSTTFTTVSGKIK
jgi:pilus assembly protein Flp/PilA